MTKKKIKTLKEFVKGLRMLLKQNLNAVKFYDYILENGKSFGPPTLTKKEQKVLDALFIKFQTKSCYYNAQSIAVTSSEFEYWEGWAMTEKVPIPLGHSWNTIDGNIIDVTWKDGVEYFGIKIPTNYIRKFWLANGRSEALMKFYIAKKLGL